MRLAHRLEQEMLSVGHTDAPARATGRRRTCARPRRPGTRSRTTCSRRSPYPGFDPDDYWLEPAPATAFVDEGDRLTIGSREFTVLHLPGHTPGGIGLIEEATGVFFSGDLLYDGPLVDGLPESNAADFAASVARIRDLPVRRVHGGHGAEHLPRPGGGAGRPLPRTHGGCREMITNPITDREHAGRIAALRDALDRQGLDAVVLYGAHRDYQPADLRYFARWYCVEEETAALFVPTGRPGRAHDRRRAGTSTARKAEAYADDMRLTRDMGADLAELVREHAAASDAGGHRRLRVLPGARRT